MKIPEGTVNELEECNEEFLRAMITRAKILEKLIC